MSSIKTIPPTETDPYRVVNIVRQLVEHVNHPTHLNILDFGGIADGTTDNSTAIANAFAALGTTGGTIYFPQGKYKFTSAVTLTLPAANAIYDLTLAGDGADASILVWSSGVTNALTIAYQDTNSGLNNQSSHFRDLTFTSLGTGVDNGLVLTQSGTASGNANAALSEITRCSFRGDDGYSGTDSWQNDITINAVCNVNVNGCLLFGSSSINGGGINVAGVSSPNLFAVVLNLIGTTINNKNIGLNIGSFVQGVSVISSNLTDNNTAINIGAPATSDVQLLVSSSQIGTAAAGTGILGSAAYNAIELSNNLFVGSGASTLVSLTSASNFVIVGNQFTGGTTGISIPSLSASVVGEISNNVFTNLTTAITLGASVSDSVDVGLNSFAGVTNKMTGVSWIAFTPVITGSGGSAGGASTTVSGRYRQVAKTVTFQVDILWVSIGTWTGTTVFTLPVASQADDVTKFGEISNGRNIATGVQIHAITGGTTTQVIFKYDGTNQLTNADHYIISGTYEAA